MIPLGHGGGRRLRGREHPDEDALQPPGAVTLGAGMGVAARARAGAVDDLAGWLAATGLAARGSPLNDDDLAHFRDLRDALRRLAALVTADDARPAAESAIPDATAAVAVLNAAAVAVNPAAPRLQLLGGALTRDAAPSGPPVAVARAALAAEAIELLTGETSPRLRACQAPGCVLYFLKDTRAGNGAPLPAATEPAPPATTTATDPQRPPIHRTADRRARGSAIDTRSSCPSGRLLESCDTRTASRQLRWVFVRYT